MHTSVATIFAAHGAVLNRGRDGQPNHCPMEAVHLVAGLPGRDAGSGAGSDSPDRDQRHRPLARRPQPRSCRSWPQRHSSRCRPALGTQPQAFQRTPTASGKKRARMVKGVPKGPSSWGAQRSRPSCPAPRNSTRPDRDEAAKQIRQKGRGQENRCRDQACLRRPCNGALPASAGESRRFSSVAW